MKTLSEIRYKPKPEFFDKFLDDVLNDGTHSYVVVREDEIYQFWITDSIDAISEAQPDALDWLDERRHMLQEFSDGHGHTKSWTGLVYKDPNAVG